MCTCDMTTGYKCPSHKNKSLALDWFPDPNRGSLFLDEVNKPKAMKIKSEGNVIFVDFKKGK